MSLLHYIKKWQQGFKENLWTTPNTQKSTTQNYYIQLRRSLTALVITVAVLPLLILAIISLVESDRIVTLVASPLAMQKAWEGLRNEIVLVLVGGVALIVWLMQRIITALMRRLEECDAQRSAASSYMEHSQKLASVGRLAAGVAHEVNNPLAIINEKAGLAQDMVELEQNFPRREQFVRVLTDIVNSVERARAITHRMLDLSRRKIACIQEIPIQEFIDETLDFLKNNATKKSITLETHFAKDLPCVQSDKGQLQQVILNIVGNALDATAEGGTVSVKGIAQDDGIELIITDNGKGMDAQVLQHIFEPFYSTKGDDGTGLGMFITQGIVRKLGGRIEVHSKEQQGTQVHIFLPFVLTAPVLPPQA